MRYKGLLINYGEGETFCAPPPPQDRIKLPPPPSFEEWNLFAPPRPSILWLKLQAVHVKTTSKHFVPLPFSIAKTPPSLFFS